MFLHRAIAVMLGWLLMVHHATACHPTWTEDPEESLPACRYQTHSDQLERPPKLAVVWAHQIDDIGRECDNPLTVTDWNGCSDSVETNIGETTEQFYQKVCKAEDFYEKHGMGNEWKGDIYIGYIVGQYDNFKVDIRDKLPFSNGPNYESAMADVYNVFYKNITLPTTITKRGREIDNTCKWWYKLPQGFSCGKAAPPDPACEGFFDTFVPVPCSEMEVKLLAGAAPTCPRREAEDPPSIINPSRPDCWAAVNWT